MNFNKQDIHENNIGIYEIKNIQTGNKYIGSTRTSFGKRFKQHLWKLSTGRHKNKHLLRAYNKYDKKFEFNVISVTTKENTLVEEQVWINCCGYYNINPSATDFSHLPQEIIDKRTATYRKTRAKALEYLNQVKNNEITVEQVPKKYKKMVKDLFTRSAWNKGLGGTYDTGGLRVPKTKTKKLKQAWKNTSIRYRKKLPEIYVYTLDKTFIKKYHCSKDIEEESNNEDFHMYKYMKLRNPTGRNGKFSWFLASCNINKCANGIVKHYKGLIFSYAPLNSDIQSKSDEFSGTPNGTILSEALSGDKERATTNSIPLEQ
jgi:hypothetical protein